MDPHTPTGTLNGDRRPQRQMSGRNILGLLLPLLIIICTPILAFLFFPQDLLYDDAAFTLKYVDNISQGFGYRFNASDGQPIFGASSFLFTILASLLKFLAIESSFLYVRLPGLVGYGCVLLMAFQVLNRQHGALLGLLGIVTIVTCPQYFNIADSGLETLFGGALLCTAFYLYYFQIHIPWLMVICAALVLTKLDLLAASVVLVAAQLLQTIITNKKGFRLTLGQACFFYFLPTALFFLFCYLYFGSIIPNSLQAKLIYSKYEHGYRYLEHFFHEPYSRFLFLITCIPFVGLATLSVAVKKWPSARFFVLSGVSLGLLIQVWLTPFEEIFPWYFVIPFLSFQFSSLFAVNECAALASSGATRAIYRIAFASSVCLMLLSATLGIGTRANFIQAIAGIREWLEIVESERRDLGRLVARLGSRDQLLSTGYGWSAYDSGMKVFDHLGINTHQPVKEKWGLRGWLDKLGETKPDFIISHKERHPILASQYDLIALGWSPSLGGHSEWEVYHKKKEPLPVSDVAFLNFNEAIRESGSGHAQIRSVRDWDYAIRVGAEKVILEFPQVKFNRSLVGMYCLVNSTGINAPAQGVNCALEAVVPEMPPIVVSRKVTQRDGIVLLTMKMPFENQKGTLRIICWGDGADKVVAHVRDLFVATESF